MKPKPMTNAERQRRFKANMRRNGYICLNIWIPEEHKESFIELTRQLRVNGHIPDNSLLQWFPYKGTQT